MFWSNRLLRTLNLFTNVISIHHHLRWNPCLVEGGHSPVSYSTKQCIKLLSSITLFLMLRPKDLVFQGG